MKESLPQELILERMADPSFYPHRPEKVEVVHTHISAIFIAPPRVYKVKKPKDYGFLDFTTLEKRRIFCRREVELNRRLAPSVYRGVGSIVVEGEEIHLVEEERDDALEYCVIMEYLDPRGFLKNLLRSDLDSSRLLLELSAQTLSEFYARNPLPAELRPLAEPEAVWKNVEENFDQMEGIFPPNLPRHLLSLNQFFAEQFYRIFREVLEYRKSRYFVEGHGDLHTLHLHLERENGKNTLSILDGIEFNDRFRSLDLICDVAFLMMDLDAQGHYPFAREFAERFFQLIPSDSTHFVVLPFYLAYRAMVRAKVSLLTLVSPEVPDPLKSDAYDQLKTYLTLATRYAFNGFDPTIFAFCGLSGSGKSTLAEGLKDLISVERIASDRVRKALAGIPPLSSSSSSLFGGIYTPEMSRRVYDTMRARAVEQAQKTGVAIVDATYLKGSYRRELSDFAQNAGVRTVWIALDEAKEVLEERVRNRRGSESEATVEVLHHQLKSWEIPVMEDIVLYLPATASLEFLGHALIFAHLRYLSSFFRNPSR